MNISKRPYKAWQRSAQRKDDRRPTMDGSGQTTRSFLPPIPTGPVYLVCGGNNPVFNEDGKDVSPVRSKKKIRKKHGKKKYDQTSGRENQQGTEKDFALPASELTSSYGAVHESNMQSDDIASSGEHRPLSCSRCYHPQGNAAGQGEKRADKPDRNAPTADRAVHESVSPIPQYEQLAASLRVNLRSNVTQRFRELKVGKEVRFSQKMPHTEHPSHEVLRAGRPRQPTLKSGRGNEIVEHRGKRYFIPSDVHESSVRGAGNGQTERGAMWQLVQPDSRARREGGCRDEKKSRRLTERLQRVARCDTTDPAAQERIKVRVMVKRLDSNDTDMNDDISAFMRHLP